MHGYLSADFDAMLSADVEALVDGVSPFAQLAGALVARRKAAVADKEANRRRAAGTRGFHRAVRLLSERLSDELRTIFDEALKSPHGLHTRGSSGSILLVDELLLRRMKALGCRPADLKRLEATCRSACSGASAAEIRVETGHALAAASEQSVDVRRIAQIALADWVIMDPDAALTGQADADPLIVADRQRQTKVTMERLSENSGMAASIDELDRWCATKRPPSLHVDGGGRYVRQVALASCLWNHSVAAEWDKVETLHRVKPCINVVYRVLQTHIAGVLPAAQGMQLGRVREGLPAVQAGALFLEPSGADATAVCWPLSRPSIITSHLLRWLMTDARCIAGEGGVIQIDGGYGALAAAVLHTASPTPKEVREVRTSLDYLSRLWIAVPRRESRLNLPASVVTIETDGPKAADGRRRALRLRIGDAFTLSGVPTAAEGGPGLKHALRWVPVLPFRLLPPLVLGPRVRVRESVLADELIRRMVETSAEYVSKGTRVDVAALKSILCFAGLSPTDASAMRLRAAWLGGVGTAAPLGAFAPLFVEVAEAMWQVNPAVWPEGHAFILEGGRRSLEGRQNTGSVRWKGGGSRR